ncbi:MAG: type II CAAX endopeptidase family protein [Nocardioides sp.]
MNTTTTTAATTRATRPIRPMTVRTTIPFFAMAFGLTWGIAAVAIVFAEQLEPYLGPLGLTNPLFFLAVYAPAFAGMGLVLRHYGFRGLRSYLRRLTLWRIPLGWATYLVIGVPAAFYLGAWVKGSPLSFPFTPWYAVAPALLLMLALGPMEEFGWRGVALPLLQQKFRPFFADLIISTLWALWHLPAFFLSGTPQSQWSFPAFFVGVVSISFILTPLFNASGGSILVAALYHFQMNNPIWPDAQPYDSLFFGAIAVAAVVINRTAMFSRTAGVTSVLRAGDEAALSGATALATTEADSSRTSSAAREPLAAEALIA